MISNTFRMYATIEECKIDQSLSVPVFYILNLFWLNY